MAGTLSQASDERLKTNITTSPHGLADVLKMRGVNYQWKAPERGDQIELGLIAQEVESIIPEVVRTNSDGFKSIAYSNLIPLLVEAIKDLKREKDQEMERMVKAHRAEIQQLKAENQEIRAKLDLLMQHMTLTPD
jgi:hypothetical protein